MHVRRVVTGHSPDGKATVVQDVRVAPVTVALSPGSEFHQLWGSDSTCDFPDDGSSPTFGTYFPPVGGFRFGFFTIPPDGAEHPPLSIDLEVAYAELNEKLPGLAEHAEPDEPGMHTTATVDYGIVLSGQATMELDDGVTVVLDAGDTYIQNGTRHRWSNTGNVPAVLAVTLIGANHQHVG